MKTAQQIKQQIVQALEDSGVFDTVLTPSDDRMQSTVMREPAAAIFFSGFSTSDDNGISLLTAKFTVLMKFLKISVNDTAEDIEEALQALSCLEPLSIKQSIKSGENGRSAVYKADVIFAGCR